MVAAAGEDAPNRRPTAAQARTRSPAESCAVPPRHDLMRGSAFQRRRRRSRRRGPAAAGRATRRSASRRSDAPLSTSARTGHQVARRHDKRGRGNAAAYRPWPRCGHGRCHALRLAIVTPEGGRRALAARLSKSISPKSVADLIVVPRRAGPKHASSRRSTTLPCIDSPIEGICLREFASSMRARSYQPMSRDLLDSRFARDALERCPSTGRFARHPKTVRSTSEFVSKLRS